MKALRSLESTSAPHLIILSTSLDQALLAQTLLQMMCESWHSVQAVRTLA